MDKYIFIESDGASTIIDANSDKEAVGAFIQFIGENSAIRSKAMENLTAEQSIELFNELKTSYNLIAMYKIAETIYTKHTER